MSDLGKAKSPNHLFPVPDTSTITLAGEVSNNEMTSTSKAATLQGRTDNLKSSERLQKKRELTTDTEMKTPADVPVKKRWKPNGDGATDNETSKPKGVHEGDVTPLGELGEMLSTMESLMKRKPSMPIEETKWVDLPECSVEEKIAYVEAMSPAFPQLCYYSSKFASDVVQHHKQLSAKEQSKREETEALCNVAEREIEKLKERLVAAEKEVSAANTKVKQQEAKYLDLCQRNANLEAAKSAAETEALEAKQQAIELGSKTAKLEAVKSAAEVEAAKEKKQAIELGSKASKLEAAKSAAEFEAAKAKQQAIELGSNAAKLEAAKSAAKAEAAKAKKQADKSAAEAEAAEAPQQAIELGSKAAKLEAAKSAAEAEAAKAKQQAVELGLRVTELEAAKSAAETEAAEAKKQVVESQWRAATAEKKVIDAQQLVAKEREEREALKTTFDKSFKELQEFSTLLGG
ncbi:uncharacterized abhydrolase domain-containing protein DDB_G0269086-like [Papaver somniferum]|uniref:uncharacterized abhydrolase domain-containing protein DDB_G0269086-like n=1 Tax=Papaver somniferum TaxID=3469 RepID=UPI000E6F9EA8|nr:uncharacterized abhydrolase domain-containing protein DDB_G0269086-like [Papaver somniferum]